MITRSILSRSLHEGIVLKIERSNDAVLVTCICGAQGMLRRMSQNDEVAMVFQCTSAPDAAIWGNFWRPSLGRGLVFRADRGAKRARAGPKPDQARADQACLFRRPELARALQALRGPRPEDGLQHFWQRAVNTSDFSENFSLKPHFLTFV
jgi:hypothetical protein